MPSLMRKTTVHRKTGIEKKIRALLHASASVSRRAPYSLTVLAGGGSDRVFYRVTVAGESFVVLSPSGSHADIRPYLSVGTFLAQCGIGVPQIIAADLVHGLVLMEDLGDNSLYKLLHEARSRSTVMALYRDVVAALAQLQTQATPRMQECAYLRNRSFGYEALRWETDYFLECFIRQYCGLSPANEEALDTELHLLATSLAQEQRCFMHRDFQSKNIYIKNGVVRMIDFQTATCGLPHYDLASLLKDAYFILDPQERSTLLATYHEELASRGGISHDRQHFADVFERAGIQRNMQALGAFAYLSCQKGKHEFARYIPAALHSLQQALAGISDYPCLTATVSKARTVVENRRT